MKIAIVEPYPSNINYTSLFPEVETTLLSLTDSKRKKVYKKDIELDLDSLDTYDYLILVGAEVCKFVGKFTGVSNLQGHLIEGKYLPLTNPSMYSIKPAAKPMFDKAVARINNIISGEETVDSTIVCKGLQNREEILEYLNNLNSDIIAVDTETSALYPRKGYVLGICLCADKDYGVYIDSDYIDEEITNKLQGIFNTYTCVFHNAKFDVSFLKFHFGFTFKHVEDTMGLHYLLDETTGTQNLKYQAATYTNLGTYDFELDQFKSKYCRTHKIAKKDFTYDLIPFDIMYKYAAKDAIATFRLFTLYTDKVTNNSRLYNIYRSILLPATKALTQIENAGVPIDLSKAIEVNTNLTVEIDNLKKSLYEFPAIKEFEKREGKEFNPASNAQVIQLLYSDLKLKPSGILTDTGAHSVNKESLDIVGRQHKIVQILSKIKTEMKIKGTYMNNILAHTDVDNRLRSNFNIYTTTSGRLSSSGTINLQNLPRDDKRVKSCIVANPGYIIFNHDLKNAETYVAAALSKDKGLARAFSTGEDIHGSIAKESFRLKCLAKEVKELFPEQRQAAKAISFGILYGASANKLKTTLEDEGMYLSLSECEELISQYHSNFPLLKKWIDSMRREIKDKGKIYSAFGRCRRLKDIRSSKPGVVAHEIRSGFNFLVQSVASDINLLAVIDMVEYINKNNMKSKIIALVHDSIVGEVLEEEKEEYNKVLTGFMQKNRGVAIPNCPIGIDVEEGTNYAFI